MSPYTPPLLQHTYYVGLCVITALKHKAYKLAVATREFSVGRKVSLAQQWAAVQQSRRFTLQCVCGV